MRKVLAISKQTVEWKEALQEFLFLKKAEGISETTLQDYNKHICRFFKRYPEAWRSDDLKKCVFEYMADKIKPATYNLRLIYLRAFFEWSKREGYLTTNPLALFKRRKASERVVDIKEDILLRLLQLPNQRTYTGLRDYALILLTLDTGIRPREAIQLHQENFDLRHCIVTIPREVSKTRIERTLPILPNTAEVIRRLIKINNESWEREVPVFASCEGTQLAVDSWKNRMNLYSKKLGFKVRPYDLRHVFAVMYLRNGGNAFGLQKTLGHMDISMTKRYVHISGNDLKDSHLKASPLNKLMPKKVNSRIRNIIQ